MSKTVRPPPPPFQTHGALSEDGLGHGFFGRRGGISEGIYESLNCGYGSGDDDTNVMFNREAVAHALGIEQTRLLTVHQWHSAEVATIDRSFDPFRRPKVDAQVTADSNVALCVLAADCAPVLFADVEAHVVGAAHAGWKGALGGVLEATLRAMEAIGAARGRIAAAIGPCISRHSYEVGPEFRIRFLEADVANEDYFTPSANAGRHMFDLPGYVESRLERAGVRVIANLKRCTYQNQTAYFSYRRAVHRGESDYGRNISAILLRS